MSYLKKPIEYENPVNLKSSINPQKPMDIIEYDLLPEGFKKRAQSKEIFTKFLNKQTIDAISSSKIPTKIDSPMKDGTHRLSAWGYLIRSIASDYFGPPTDLIYKTLPNGGIPLWWAHPWLPKKSKYYALELKPEIIEKLIEGWFPFLEKHYKNDGILSTDSSDVDRLYVHFQRTSQREILEKKQQTELAAKLANLSENETEVKMFGQTLFPCHNREYSYQEIEGAIWLMELEMARIGQLVSTQAMIIRLRQFVSDLEQCLFDKAFIGLSKLDNKGFLRAFRAVLQAYAANPEMDLSQCQYRLKTKSVVN